MTIAEKIADSLAQGNNPFTGFPLVASGSKNTKKLCGDTFIIESTYGDDRYWIAASVMVTGQKVAAMVSEVFPKDPDRDQVHSFNAEELKDMVASMKIRQYDELAEKWFDRFI